VWEASEAPLYAGNAGTITSGNYDTGMAAIDNSSAGYVGGTFKFAVIAPTSSSGTVTIYLQRSSDAGATWPDNGRGSVVSILSFSGAGTDTDEVEL
jgi:hypothetical protein